MTSAATPSDANRWRYRLRFRKADDLRLVSHHDLMHCVERLLRRAELPIAYSQGFHPQPKFAFALSLALGVVGSREVLELELTENLSADDVMARMQKHAPPGMTFLSVRTIEGKSSLLVRRAFYRFLLPSPLWGEEPGVKGQPRAETSDSPAEDQTTSVSTNRDPLSSAQNEGRSPLNIDDAIAEFLAKTEAWVIRERPNRRRLNVRPFVESLSHSDGVLNAALWITPTGAARPEEVFSQLGLAPLIEDGAVIERSDLELLDELPEAERTMPAIVGAVSEEIPGDDRGRAARKADSASAMPTPLLSNPLSFDT
jgi:hypothetical protein